MLYEAVEKQTEALTRRRERESANETASPTPHPYGQTKSQEKMGVLGVGEKELTAWVGRECWLRTKSLQLHGRRVRKVQLFFFFLVWRPIKRERNLLSKSSKEEEEGRGRRV